jgi:hypothetical protein
MGQIDQQFLRHDVGTSSDPKIVRLEVKYGDTGYSIFWKTLEYLFTQGGKAELDIKTISYVIRRDEETVSNIINDCINDFHLFESDDVYFWSNRLLRHIEKIGETSKKRSEAGKSGKGNKPLDSIPPKPEENFPMDTTEKQMLNKCPSIDKHLPNYKIKENIKEYNTIVQNGKHEEENDNTFNEFWKVYPKKQAKAEASKAWNQLNPSNGLMAIIINAIQQQKISDAWQKNQGQFIPLASTWLRGGRWEDEMIDQESTGPHEFIPNRPKTIFDDDYRDVGGAV